MSGQTFRNFRASKSTRSSNFVQRRIANRRMLRHTNCKYFIGTKDTRKIILIRCCDRCYKNIDTKQASSLSVYILTIRWYILYLHPLLSLVHSLAEPDLSPLSLFPFVTCLNCFCCVMSNISRWLFLSFFCISCGSCGRPSSSPALWLHVQTGVMKNYRRWSVRPFLSSLLPWRSLMQDQKINLSVVLWHVHVAPASANSQ